MKRNWRGGAKFFTAILLVLTFLILSGCGGETSREDGGGGGGGEPGTVSGYVSQSNGGPALSGSTVTSTARDGSRDTATTDENGYYILNVTSGKVDVEANKSGYAASKAQEVILSGQSGKTVNLIQKPLFNNSWSVTAPTISVSGVSADETVSGIVRITVTVTADNPVKDISVFVGNYASAPSFWKEDSNTYSFDWDVNETPGNPNSSYLHFVAYDINFNRTQMTMPVKISQGSGSAPSTGPLLVVNYFLTFGLDVGEFSTRRAERFKQLKIKKNPYLVEYAPGKKFDLRSIPQNTSIFGIVEWEGVSDAGGYSIYRRTSSETVFRLVGDVPATGDFFETFYDLDPTLTPGQTYQYSVSAYNINGEGPNTDSTAEVTILEAFHVNLISPSDNETNVSTSPTFTWSPSKIVGESQLYSLGVLGVNDDQFSFEDDLTDVTSSTGASLTNNKVYEWDLYLCVAVGSYDYLIDNYLAQSYPNPVSTSTNGSFIFTTEP